MKKSNAAKLFINGKEAVLDVIRRRSETETWVFLRTPRRIRYDIVYAISYDVTKQEIMHIDKFTDTIGKTPYLELLFPSGYNTSSAYEDFVNETGLGRWNHVMFGDDYRRVNYGPFVKVNLRSYGQLSDLTKGQQKKINTPEKQDLENIIEQLRTSHIDFSVIGETIKRTPYWLDPLQSCKGVIKNSLGEETPYSFVLKEGTAFYVLDDKKNKVGQVGRKGFIYEKPV